MDNHAIELVIGLCLIAFGAFMAFNKRYYSDPSKQLSGFSQKIFGRESTVRLARFQAAIVFLLGVAFIVQSLSNR
jgi:hypothetical protein